MICLHHLLVVLVHGEFREQNRGVFPNAICLIGAYLDERHDQILEFDGSLWESSNEASQGGRAVEVVVPFLLLN